MQFVEEEEEKKVEEVPQQLTAKKTTQQLSVTQTSMLSEAQIEKEKERQEILNYGVSHSDKLTFIYRDTGYGMDTLTQRTERNG